MAPDSVVGGRGPGVVFVVIEVVVAAVVMLVVVGAL